MRRREFLTSFQTAATGKPSFSDTESIFALAKKTSQDPPSLEPYAGPWNRSTIMHLLRRTLIAPTVEERRLAETMTMEELVARLTDPTPEIRPAPPFIQRWLDEPERFFPAGDAGLSDVMESEIRSWWCQQMIEKKLHIQERMTLFWHNHFACDATLALDQRSPYVLNQLLRQHALGNFRQLVREVTLDKNMLYFLNGLLNKKGDINENYGRELQELFTLGATDNEGNPNYTQKDISEAARALSGWYFSPSGINGKVVSVPGEHDAGDKVIYGKQLSGDADGGVELDRLLDLIFEKEAAARYVIRKLYRFFLYTSAPLTPFIPVAADVEEHIIAPLAADFRNSNWNIAVVMRRLLLSRHFYDQQAIASQIKSPVDLFVGTVRALTVVPPPGDYLRYQFHTVQYCARHTGQTLLVPPGVQGWQFYRSWISSATLPMRRSFTDKLIDGIDIFWSEYPGAIDKGPQQVHYYYRLDVMPYVQQFPSHVDDPYRLIINITDHLLAYPASTELRGQLLQILLQGAPTYEWVDFGEDLQKSRLQSMFKFLMRSSNYQLM